MSRETGRKWLNGAAFSPLWSDYGSDYSKGAGKSACESTSKRELMLRAWLKNRRLYQRTLEAEVQTALSEHGDQASDRLRRGVREARQRHDMSSAAMLGQVLRLIRKRSGKDQWVDTGTRYSDR